LDRDYGENRSRAVPNLLPPIRDQKRVRVYKPLAERYKAAVLEAEELFYNIKALDKSVRKGDYDSKTEEFKKVWQPLKQALDANLIEAKEIEGQLNNVEPMYQRLAPKIEVIVDRAMP